MAGPTTLFQTGDHASRPAASAGCVLYWCTTHEIVYVSSGSAWSSFQDLSGFSGSGIAESTIDAKGDILAGTADNTVDNVTVGSNGTVLMADSGQTAGVRWHALSNTEYTLSGDVTMTNANQAYDGASGTPTAGTYDVIAFVSIKNATNNVITTFVGRLLNGSTVVDERQASFYGNDNGYPTIVPLAARVTMNGSDALKVTGVADRAGCTMNRDPFSNSSGVHRATLIKAVRVA